MRTLRFLLQKEIEFQANLLSKPARPFVAVVGGSKVSGKLEALISLVEKVDKIVIGGGMAFTFLKAQGHEVGKSLVEEDLLEDARNIMLRAKERGVKFYLPVDLVVADKFSDVANTKNVTFQEIPQSWMGLDIGPASSILFRQAIQDAHTIVWNGPMGVYELDAFAKGSLKMSHAIAETHATSIVGGGDTADVVQRAGDIEEMTFVSTGGGASLELIEGKVLPGVEVLL
ncbi:MAG: phosphoglycerate kinase [Epsilonproteobacteria bacterium]|nr:phosphoglycerate kinase [Campylobacterota bacterium]